MYSPSAFSVTDPLTVRNFIRQNGFGILLSLDGGTFHDTHTPLMISDDLTRLTGHIARANPQWHAWKKQSSVKVIFHGPHAYISPRYYCSEFNVPTWNYSAVSIDGTVEITEDPQQCLQTMQDLILQYEGEAGWQLNTADSRYMKLLEAVVCFSIEVRNIETKFKLNQNKSDADRESVIAHLLQSNNALDKGTGEMMKLERQIR